MQINSYETPNLITLEYYLFSNVNQKNSVLMISTLKVECNCVAMEFLLVFQRIAKWSSLGDLKNKITMQIISN